MSLIELLIISIGLSMDAFAVSVCKGLSTGEADRKKHYTVGIYFGVFQGLMPIIGYLLGYRFHSHIESIDHWIAFVLLGLIGLNMIKESREEDNQCAIEDEDAFSFKKMCILGVATSIDALAVGITFAFLQVDILKAASMIGITTFLISTIGVSIGCKFGSKFKSKAELAGGIILIVMGTKILLEHLGILVL